MPVFAEGGTLLSYAVMRQERDSFDFGVMGGVCGCVCVSKTEAWIIAANLESSNIPKERKRSQGQSPFCYCFAMSARDCYSSFSFFYHEETVPRAAALLSCISVRECCYTSLMDQLSAFHKGKVKSQIAFCVCSTACNTWGESTLGFGWSWCIWSCPLTYM